LRCLPRAFDSLAFGCLDYTQIRMVTPARRPAAICRRAARTCTAMPWPRRGARCSCPGRVEALDAVAAPGARRSNHSLARSSTWANAGDHASSRSRPQLRPEAFSGAFWNACHGGQLATAQYLLAHGADLNWPAAWSGQTPLDIAEQAGRSDVVAWLLEMGATGGKKSARPSARLCLTNRQNVMCQHGRTSFDNGRGRGQLPACVRLLHPSAVCRLPSNRPSRRAPVAPAMGQVQTKPSRSQDVLGCIKDSYSTKNPLVSSSNLGGHQCDDAGRRDGARLLQGSVHCRSLLQARDEYEAAFHNPRRGISRR
jgi:hypothetical protein